MCVWQRNWCHWSRTSNVYVCVEMWLSSCPTSATLRLSCRPVVSRAGLRAVTPPRDHGHHPSSADSSPVRAIRTADPLSSSQQLARDQMIDALIAAGRSHGAPRSRYPDGSGGGNAGHGSGGTSYGSGGSSGSAGVGGYAGGGGGAASGGAGAGRYTDYGDDGSHAYGRVEGSSGGNGSGTGGGSADLKPLSRIVSRSKLRPAPFSHHKPSGAESDGDGDYTGPSPVTAPRRDQRLAGESRSISPRAARGRSGAKEPAGTAGVSPVQSASRTLGEGGVCWRGAERA